MKAREEDGTIKTYSELPQDWNNILNFRMAPVSVQQAMGFYDLVHPVYDSANQVLGEIYFDAQNMVFTYPVIDKTTEQLYDEKQRLLDRLDSELNVKSIRTLLAVLAKPILENPEVTQDQLDALSKIYPQYRAIPYEAGDVFVYENVLYKVIQPHTALEGWDPSELRSQYVRFTPAGVIAEWVQPIMAEDSYPLGAKVTHNGYTWESTVANNTWEPGVYGWDQL